MAQSLCKLYIHVIFHIKTTSPNVLSDHLPRLHQYIGKIVNKTGSHVICVGGTDNHVHVLAMLAPTVTVALLTEEMKRNSSRWIKTLSPHYEKFAWQAGYAAFSVSQSIIEKTTHYIQSQEDHHKKVSFREEYLQFLQLYKIEYDERYVMSD